MSSDSAPETDKTGQRLFAVACTTAIVVVAVLVGGILKPIERDIPTQPKRQQSTSSANSTIPEGGFTESEPNFEQLAVFKSRKARVSATANSVQDVISEARQTSEWRDKRVASLLNDDTGKRIAASDELIEMFLVVRDIQSGGYQQLQQLSDEVDAVNRKLSMLRSANDVQKLTQHEAQLQSSLERAGEALAKANEAKRDVDVILLLAEDQDPSQRTLAEGIADYELRFAVDTARRVARLKKNSRIQLADEIESQARGFTAQIRDAERDIAASKERVRVAQAKGQQEMQRRKVANAQLENELKRDLKEVRSLLSPFISKGRTQHLMVNGYRLDDDPTPRPVSLGRLRAVGHLAQSQDALMELWRSTSSNNDRPLGAFPDSPSGHIGFEAALPSVRRAQALLIKYGDLLVDKGLLSP